MSDHIKANIVNKIFNEYNAYIERALVLYKSAKITEDDFKQMIKYGFTPKVSSCADTPEIVTVRDELDVYPFMRFNRISENTLRQVEKEFEDVVKVEEALKREFVVATIDHMLYPVAVLLCNHLLFQEDTKFDRLMAAKLLLLSSDTKKVIKMHNWAAIKQMPSNFFYDYGAIIDNMQCPLFPTQITELQKELEKLLNELNQVKELYKTLNEDYTKEMYSKYFDNNNIFLGGWYLAVYDAQGSKIGVTDVTPVETEFIKVLKKLASLKNEVAKLRSAQATSQWKPRRNNYYNANNYSRNCNGRSKYNGGGYDDEYDNQQQELPLQSNAQQQIHQSQNNIKKN